MDRWDKDREEILRHWNRLGFIWKFIILYLFSRNKKVESVIYLLDRTYGRPDRMVKVGDAHWDTIRNLLRKS